MKSYIFNFLYVFLWASYFPEIPNPVQPIPQSADTPCGILPSACIGSATPDNAAIAIRDIQPGDKLYIAGATSAKPVYVGVSKHDILEGHRFAVAHVASGGALTSWGITFGLALRDIEPGEYLCNIKVCFDKSCLFAHLLFFCLKNQVITSLKERRPDIQIPLEPNFVNAPFHRSFRNPVSLVSHTFSISQYVAV